MPKILSHNYTLIKRLLIVLGFYVLFRLLFYFFNLSYFSDLTFGHLAKLMFDGLRFDISAIILINSIYIILYLLPLPFRHKKWFSVSLKTLFLVTNAIAYMANCIDLVYFKFTFKRSTSDVFAFFTMGNDLARLTPLFLKDYWYLFVLWVSSIWATSYLYTKAATPKQQYDQYGLRFYTENSIGFLFFLGVYIVAYRGGFQLKPISIISAGAYSNPHDIPLVINTPFSIIKTIDHDDIEEPHYFPKAKLKTLYSPLHYPHKQGKFKKLNVVVIILESFSKEYVGSLNNRPRGSTPFLDSLISQSLVFTNAFSDGKRSIEGIPAVTASLPTWMDDPYISSKYNANLINSLAKDLKDEGYNTAFYHGGTNGTMGFDAFTKFAGYDKYYGRTEYNNEADYDGHWGIWDEKFFQYFAHHLNKDKQPFFATIFSLSSHHPYSIPKKYQNRFKQEGNEIPIMKSVRYADFSLGEFFKTASKMPWFDNTLFVLTPDHTGPSADPFYSDRLGMYEIPIIFYRHNSNLRGKDTITTQQIDIMPSILDYLDYDKPYFAFGQSAFDSTQQHYAVNYINNVYEIIHQHYALQFENNKTIGLYNFAKDSLLKNNLMTKKPVIRQKLENHLKAVLQTYAYDLIHNKMTVKTATQQTAANQ